MRYARHPLAFLVEAADDICYTIIDFEDGINLGLIPEPLALEYMEGIIQKRINRNKYEQLQTKEERIAYLRAVAIGTLIQEATDIFLANEAAILQGDFHQSLLKLSQYTTYLSIRRGCRKRSARLCNFTALVRYIFYRNYQ